MRLFLAVLAACNLIAAAMLAPGASYVAALNIGAAAILGWAIWTGGK